MRKVAVLTFVTLDGVIQSPGGPQEDTSGGFTHGGWVAGYWDDVLGEVMSQQMRPPFDLLLGRRTYDLFAGFWPHAGDAPGAKELNEAKKFVVSRSQRKLDWANSVLITGDVVPQIQKLKTADGPEIQVHGSADLIQTLLRHDLVDELRLKIFPVTLGAGKRVFGDGTVPAGFRLLGSQASPSGVMIANYARSGPVKTGSFGP